MVFFATLLRLLTYERKLVKISDTAKHTVHVVQTADQPKQLVTLKLLISKHMQKSVTSATKFPIHAMKKM